MSDTENEEQRTPDGMNSPLCRKLMGGRGGAYHRAAINSIFTKLTRHEADVLGELVKHHEDDAEQAGKRRQQRQPWRR